MSLYAEEQTYRTALRIFADGCVNGRAGKKVIVGMTACAELLIDVGHRWRRAIEQWEYEHDMLILGVPS